MPIGYKLATEGVVPKELIRQAVLAEQARFDFVEMSDHPHPRVGAQGHSAFTWSLLSAISTKTERTGLVTGVTCPSFRYHPAIIAQAAATLAIISDGRFTLGVGAGERLNEHVVGPKRHLDVARRFADAGFGHLVAMNAGRDPDGLTDFFASELAAPPRALTSAAA